MQDVVSSSRIHCVATLAHTCCAPHATRRTSLSLSASTSLGWGAKPSVCLPPSCCADASPQMYSDLCSARTL